MSDQEAIDFMRSKLVHYELGVQRVEAATQQWDGGGWVRH